MIIEILAKGVDLMPSLIPQEWEEIYRVEIEFPQIVARQAIEIFPAFGKCFKAAVEPLRQKRDCTSEVTQHPFDSWESFDDAAEDQTRRCEGCIE